jgi:hypothetical protein
MKLRVQSPGNRLLTEKPFMNANQRNADEGDSLLDTLAAELTNAVYPVALRHGKESSWVDLELDLWRVLAETVQKWRPELPRRG